MFLCLLIIYYKTFTTFVSFLYRIEFWAFAMCFDIQDSSSLWHVSRVMQSRESDFFLNGINNLFFVTGTECAYYEVGTDFICDMHEFIVSRGH